MTRDEENMMLSFLESSAQNDMSISEHYASTARMKQAFAQMYRAKSQEGVEKDLRIQQLEKQLAEKDAKTPLQPTQSIILNNPEIKELIVQKQVDNEIQHVAAGATGIIEQKS